MKYLKWFKPNEGSRVGYLLIYQNTRTTSLYRWFSKTGKTLFVRSCSNKEFKNASSIKEGYIPANNITLTLFRIPITLGQIK